MLTVKHQCRIQSGLQDLNLRSSAPKADAIPSFAKPRDQAFLIGTPYKPKSGRQDLNLRASSTPRKRSTKLSYALIRGVIDLLKTGNSSCKPVLRVINGTRTRFSSVTEKHDNPSTIITINN